MAEFSLKRIEISQSLSEETVAFGANIYRNGKLCGHVKNGGRGGSNEYYFEGRGTEGHEEAFDAFIKALPQLHPLDDDPEAVEREAFWIDALLTEFQDMKFIKSKVAAGHLIVKAPDAEPGHFFIYALGLDKRGLAPETLEAVFAKNPAKGTKVWGRVRGGTIFEITKTKEGALQRAKKAFGNPAREGTRFVCSLHTHEL